MSRLILIRHVESVANSQNLVCGQLDLPVNGPGLAQIASLRQMVSKLKIENKVYCSPLKRAIETAAAIAETFEIEPLLNEINTGEYSKLTYDELYSQHPDYRFYPQKGLRFPGGESVDDLFVRGKQFLDKYDFKNGQNTVVSHSGMINAICQLLLEVPQKSFPAFTIANANAVECNWDHEIQIWKIRKMNVSLNEVAYE